MEVCNRYGGHLAVVTSSERTNELSNLIKTSDLPSKQHKAYIGLHDMAQEGQFVSVLGNI